MTFFDQYTYRQKNYALLILSVLLFAVTYKKAILVTLETKKYRNELEQKLTRAEGADREIRSEMANLALLDNIIGKENATVDQVQQGFLNFIAKHSKGIRVYEISEVLEFKHPDYTINTHRIVIKGDFLKTLDLIYALEKEFKLARVLNVSCEYKRYSIDSDLDLYTTVLLQNYLK